MPIILGLFILFVIWFQYEKRKVSKKQIAEKRAFITRERDANLARKQDISNLDYVTLTKKDLPLEKGADEVVNQFIDDYLSFLPKKIINLSHYSNTELKEKYGLANLNALSEYDENYYSLVKLLNDWGQYLLNNNCLKEAAQVLEYALSIKSEIAESYVSLAKVYKQLQCPDKITEVKATYTSISDNPSQKILTELDKIAFQSLVDSAP